MDRPAGLAEFLRTRRALLRPEDAGIVVRPDRRREPGVVPQELARLAGISTDYYARLEQGRCPHASDGVVDAVARALGLNDADTAHLRQLARPRRCRRPRPQPAATVGEPVRRLVQAMDRVPAVIHDRRTNVLAWNPLGHALLAGHLAADSPRQPGSRPNLARMLFLDDRTRALYPRWQTQARRCVASLHLASRDRPDDRELGELVGELTVR